MDDERFNVLYLFVRELAPPRDKRCQYSDGDILLVFLWAAWRQKPVCWACQQRNAPRQLQGRDLPSPSRMSRRLRTDGFKQLLQLVISALQQQLLATALLVGCWSIDAKGFAVNHYSKDKHAKLGWCCGRKARGYKLFLIIDARGVPVAWHVDSMNVAEPTAAVQLIEHLDRPGYLLGDCIYDSDKLFKLAHAKGVQLIAPRKEPHKNVGKDARSEPRMHAIAMLETKVNTFGPAMYATRTAIERKFAQWSASDVGLDHLPGWVRTPQRVRRWIDAKIFIAMCLGK